MFGVLERSAIGRLFHATLLIGVLGMALAASEAQADGGGNHSAPAAPAQARAQGEALSQDIVDLGRRHGRATGAEKGRILADLKRAAQERHDLLADLIQGNPGEVLRLALPDRILGGMPAEARAWLEQRAEIEGELEVLHIDMPDAADSRFAYFLKTDLGERFSLHFAGRAPDWVSGTAVRAGGVLLDGVEARDAAGADGAIAVEAGDEGIQNLAFAGGNGNGGGGTPASGLTNTMGEQRTLVIAVNFQDKPNEQPWTLAQISDVVFGATDAFFRENSWNQTWLTGDVYGWYTIAVNSNDCNTTTIQNLADAAAASGGVDVTSYGRVAYFYPTNSACGFSGAASLGGSPSHVYVNGTLDSRVVVHEFSHTLGLRHAHGLECGGAALGSNCTNTEYADPLDVMGSRLSQVGAFHKERLGWLGYGSSPPTMTVTTDGSYTVATYENSGGTPKALKILKSTDPVTGARTWYYIEHREPIGFDGWIASDPYVNAVGGVTIRTGKDGDGDSSNLLDMTPGSEPVYDWFDSALVAGQSFTDAAAGVSITALSADGAGAAVAIDVTPPPCVRDDPLVAMSPGESQWVPAGSAVAYTLTVTNQDGPECAAASFSLSRVMPSGWTGTFDLPSIALAPGASGSPALTVTSPTSAANGYFTIAGTATNAADTAHTASSSATYVVSNPAVNQPPVAVNDSKSFTTIAPVSIPVLFNDSDPDGDVLAVTVASQGAKGTVTINSNGTLTYTPNSRFKGSDSFAYTIGDGHGGLASASVTVTKKRR